MRARTRAMAAAGLTSIALVATACGGGDTAPEPGTKSGAGTGRRDHRLRLHPAEPSCCPASPQRPAAATSWTSSTAKLVHYDTETAAPENDIAESIETNDNQNFTVKIKPGYKFADGTEVKAKNFVDAWNYAAYGANGQAPYFFGPIEGYADDAAPTRLQGCRREGQAMTGSEGRRRHHLHHQDVREGLQPAGPSRLHRLRAAAGRFFAEAGAKAQKCRSAAGPFKVDEEHRHRDHAREEPELLRRLQPHRRQDHLPDLQRRQPPPTPTWSATSSTSPTSSRSDQLVGDAYKTELRGSHGQPGRRRQHLAHLLPDRRAAEGQPELAQGHLDGRRPRPDHQADLQQRRHRPTAASPRSSRLQGRAVR